jgi:choline dehydrogenase-like flavoprotein
MMHTLEALRDGYVVEADAVVVGTGAGGAVAAANLAAAGFKVVVLEAGPPVGPGEMTRDAPRFLARYFWEGGLRMMHGSAPVPAMQGRCVGGSTISNSAIMYQLPAWIRQEWIEKDGLKELADASFDRAFERIMTGTSTAPTPMEAQGPRNLILRDALEKVGIPSNPLPRAVKGCKGCADCLVGCACGAKQSMDRTYIPQAMRDGAEVYPYSHAERILWEGTRAVGVTGRVVDPKGFRTVARFTVRAPRVVLAAGATHTPVILQQSGVRHRGRVGATLKAHVAGGVVGIMDRPMHPWVGATQGWGAISKEVKGLKYESLWADPSVMLVKWGGMGPALMQRLPEIAHATVGAVVYRGECTGRVRARWNGSPALSLWVPKHEAQVVFRAMKQMADGLLRSGARYVFAGNAPGLLPEEMRTEKDTEALLSTRLTAAHLPMTGNHIFCSVRMGADDRDRAVDGQGRVRGVDGVWVADASLFPSPSAVNPQATIMALSDVITRRIADLAA